MNRSRGLSQSLILKVTPEMFVTIREQADSEGKSVAQWVREAIAAKANKPKAEPWLDIETRDGELPGDVVRDIRDAINRFHNRGGK